MRKWKVQQRKIKFKRISIYDVGEKKSDFVRLRNARILREILVVLKQRACGHLRQAEDLRIPEQLIREKGRNLL